MMMPLCMEGAARNLSIICCGVKWSNEDMIIVDDDFCLPPNAIQP
jgi:hypothetical protein